MAIPDLSPPAPSNFTSPNAHSAESLMDPNFSVSDAEIDAFLSMIGPLRDDSPNGQWWHNQSQDMQMAAPLVVNTPLAMSGSLAKSHNQSQDMQMAVPPVINTPPAMAGLCIESHTQSRNNSMVANSSTPPHICKSHLSTVINPSNAVSVPPRIHRPHLDVVMPPLSKSPWLPPVDTLHMANSKEHTLPVHPISQSTQAAVVSDASMTAKTPVLPVLEHSTTAATDSPSLPPISSVPVLPTDTTLIPAAPDTLLSGGSVPLVSSAPGRCSMHMTQPSTRAEDANKIGEDAKAITSSKRKRKM
ncbi:hypothetical protein BDR03DRAFT_1014500 [Suillus americanus]|nr:hypothetical protein BDR03DRAFT_1014500 [Suillus americanus]